MSVMPLNRQKRRVLAVFEAITMRYREHYTIQPTIRKWADVALAVAIGFGLAILFFFGV